MTIHTEKKKGRKKRRRMPGPFRKVVPPREMRIGYTLLCLMLLMGAVLYWKSAYTNAQIFEAVTPSPRTTGLLNTIEERVPGVLTGAGAKRARNEAHMSKLEDLRPILPATLAGTACRRQGKVEFYSAQKLFEKIDGRADLYIEHGAVGLAVGQYLRSANPTKKGETAAEVYLYLMKTPLRAFGIYAAERRDATVESGIGETSYDEGETVFFQKGAVYAQIYGADGWTKKEYKALATEIAELLPASPRNVMQKIDKGQRRLPLEGRVGNSVKYQAEGAFGYDALEEVFIAKYEQSGTRPAFMWVSEREDEASAKKMRDAFLAGLGRNAERLPEPKNGDLADASFVRAGKLFYCAFRWDKRVGGVVDAVDRATCELLVDRLMTSIDEVDEAKGSGEGSPEEGNKK